MDVILVSDQASKVQRCRRAMRYINLHLPLPLPFTICRRSAAERAASAASGVTEWRGIVWALGERSEPHRSVPVAAS